MKSWRPAAASFRRTRASGWHAGPSTTRRGTTAPSPTILGRLDEDRKAGPWGDKLNLQLSRLQELRYGENPHQSAAFYAHGDGAVPSVARATQIQGKQLSFNNILDADAALSTVLDFTETTAVAIKHTNPCGLATSDVSLADAFRKAKAGDPVSIFGGVIALNRPVDAETAEELKHIFLEIVIAPSFTPEAREILSSAKRLLNIRLLEIDMTPATDAALDLRRVHGGVLVQDWDHKPVDVRECKVVTERQPTDDEYKALGFAWRVCHHVKSNAIVFTSSDQLLGVGAGQMSRVDSAQLAVTRAKTHGLDLAGSVVASDAFYPFRDGVDAAAEAGALAVIQPGGSIRDEEVIDAANEHGMTMIFTGIRHFRTRMASFDFATLALRYAQDERKRDFSAVRTEPFDRLRTGFAKRSRTPFVLSVAKRSRRTQIIRQKP